jgi:hypothetical protein
MNDDLLLTLHCPQCRQITEVVTEGNSLVCLDCGWRFDDKVAAKFLARAAESNGETAPPKQVNQSGVH